MNLKKKDIDIYDTVIVAVDNIETRMHLNFIYKQSKCRELIDCGISGTKAHACRINKDSYCLYCIKDLYETTKHVNICSLRSHDVEITEKNRSRILESYVYSYKDTHNTDEIVSMFNDLTKSRELQVSYEDVYEIYHNIIPSVCYINSICSSLVFYLVEDKDYNFIFYNGSTGIHINKLIMERTPCCIVCKIYHTSSKQENF